MKIELTEKEVKATLEILALGYYAEGFCNAIKKVHENQLLFVYVQGGIYGGKRVYRKRKKRLSVMRRYKT